MEDGKSKYEFYSPLNQRIIDALIAGFAYYLAYLIRFDGRIPPEYLSQFWRLFLMVMLGRVLVSSSLGTYRQIWRYIGLKDALAVARGYFVFSVILLGMRLALTRDFGVFWIPLSVIVVEFFLSLTGSLGARLLRRYLYEGHATRALNGNAGRRVLLIGAGRAGLMVTKDIAARPDLKPVGFLDDDPKKIGAVISGLRVLGPLDSLASMVTKHSVEEVIICIPHPPRATLKRLWALCEHLSVKVKIIPTIEEILHGKLNISAFRDVQMAELLGRETVDLPSFAPEVSATYQEKRILITGAGGSIGSELARQLIPLRPKELVLLDKDENGLNDVCCHFLSNGEGDAVHPVVADIRFRERLNAIFSEFHPEVVFHAAAHKHVPLMELNPCEAVMNNVIGTQNLVEVSQAHGVSRFIFISTDKAVKPTSVMGATKRTCELVIQAHCGHGQETRFACVRFGNVMGSRGSVIPLFQQQIARGGPVTLTHPDMKRYMMTIPEAVRLVIQAGVMGLDGEIFILDMGDPVPIIDLANDLIELSGLRPGKDIQIEVTELRPGEKLTEELFDQEMETALPTRFEKIWMVRPNALHLEIFNAKLADLKEAAISNVPKEVQRILPELNACVMPGLSVAASQA